MMIYYKDEVHKEQTGTLVEQQEIVYWGSFLFGQKGDYQEVSTVNV